MTRAPATVTCLEPAAAGIFSAGSAMDRTPIRMAVLDLLADVAPGPAALGAPSPEEQDFLDILRRIVNRSAAASLFERYNGSRGDKLAGIFASFDN